MADFSVIGYIRAITYKEDSVFVFLEEYKKGYKKPNGERVDDKYLDWKCIFKPYFKGYVSKHFSNGMLVQVKGEVMPYAIEHEKIVEGYSVLGQTINLASFPRSTVRNEIRAIKESQIHSSGTPDLASYQEEDF